MIRVHTVSGSKGSAGHRGGGMAASVMRCGQRAVFPPVALFQRFTDGHVTCTFLLSCP